MKDVNAFDPRLESLRGIAALAVAWGHANSAFVYQNLVPAFETLNYWTFQAFPAGAAVVLFFVLSGFVLGRSLQRDANVTRFIVRRLFRIFPALWVGVLVTYVLQITVASSFDQRLVTEWFTNVFLRPQTVADLFRNMVLAKKSIDPVIWSLIPEVVCSFLLPALVWLHQRAGWQGRAAILAGLATAGHYAGSEAIQYLVAFYSGFSLPTEVIAPRLNTWQRWTTGAIVGWLLLSLGNSYGVPYTSNMREACTAGAVILISAIVAAPGAFTFLNARPLRFLGRVSFSFYLLHLPSLFFLSAMAQFVTGSVPQNSYSAMVLALLSIGLAAWLAALAYRLVELPGIRVGKRAAQRCGNLESLGLASANETVEVQTRS